MSDMTDYEKIQEYIDSILEIYKSLLSNLNASITRVYFSGSVIDTTESSLGINGTSHSEAVSAVRRLHECRKALYDFYQNHPWVLEIVKSTDDYAVDLYGFK